MIINEAFKKLQADLPAAERIQRVCVYGGASEGSWDGYTDAARRLGEVIGEAGLDVVYGGGRTGMMGAMADGALEKDAHVIGVIPEFLDQVEVGHRDVTDLRLVPDMHTRKRMHTRAACTIRFRSEMRREMSSTDNDVGEDTQGSIHAGAVQHVVGGLQVAAG